MRYPFVIAVWLALATGYPHNSHSVSPEDQKSAPEDDSDMYMEPLEQQPQESLNAEQYEGSHSFYPSFAPFNNPPLGHSRPFLQQEGAYSHRPSAYQQQVSFDSNERFGGYKDAATGASEQRGLLGSGNFGVLRGGTFFNSDNDGDSAGYNDYSNYYQNGHGRPSFYYGGNARPRQYQQFENFRDFADINVPSNPAYSHYVIVYANKNSTRNAQPSDKPKNIIEHLALLDLETTTVQAPKKGSKTKQKLAERLPEKKHRYPKVDSETTTTTESSRDLLEPLLALS